MISFINCRWKQLSFPLSLICISRMNGFLYLTFIEYANKMLINSNVLAGLCQGYVTLFMISSRKSRGKKVVPIMMHTAFTKTLAINRSHCGRLLFNSFPIYKKKSLSTHRWFTFFLFVQLSPGISFSFLLHIMLPIFHQMWKKREFRIYR